MLNGLLEIIAAFLSDVFSAQWIAIAAPIFSIAGGIFAFIYGQAARRRDRKMRQLESQVSKIDGEMVIWGLRCIDTLSSAHTFVATNGSGRNPDEARAVRDEIQSSLSALVDAGRLYFLNRSPDLVGTERPYANRGYRPAILDALMIAHEELRRAVLPIGETRKIADNMFGARRVFIAELREEVDQFRDPKALEKLRTKDDDWAAVSELVNSFEARHGEQTFWNDRPKPRSEIIKLHKTRLSQV